jgi:hypothetical protein
VTGSHDEVALTAGERACWDALVRRLGRDRWRPTLEGVLRAFAAASGVVVPTTDRP